MEAVFSFGAVAMVVAPTDFSAAEPALAEIHWGAFEDSSGEAAPPQLSFDLGDAGFHAVVTRERLNKPHQFRNSA